MTDEFSEFTYEGTNQSNQESHISNVEEGQDWFGDQHNQEQTNNTKETDGIFHPPKEEAIDENPCLAKLSDEGKQEKAMPLFPTNLDDEVELDLQRGVLKNLSKQYKQSEQKEREGKPVSEAGVDDILAKYCKKKKAQSSNELDQIMLFNENSSQLTHSRSKSDRSKSGRVDTNNIEEEAENTKACLVKQRQEVATSMPSQSYHLLATNPQSVLANRHISAKGIISSAIPHFCQFAYLLLYNIFTDSATESSETSLTGDGAGTMASAILILAWILWILFHLSVSALLIAYFCQTNCMKSTNPQQSAAESTQYKVQKIACQTIETLMRGTKPAALATIVARLFALDLIGVAIGLGTYWCDRKLSNESKKIIWQENEFSKRYESSEDQQEEGEQQLNLQEMNSHTANYMMRQDITSEQQARRNIPC